MKNFKVGEKCIYYQDGQRCFGKVFEILPMYRYQVGHEDIVHVKQMRKLKPKKLRRRVWLLQRDDERDDKYVALYFHKNEAVFAANGKACSVREFVEVRVSK